MKPFLHAKGSVRRWGGRPSDYMSIHDFIDSSKVAMPDLRHRAALHHAFGCYLVERIFGHTVTNSDGREVSTRDIAEEHIQEDLGFLPSLEDWLDTMPIEKWHGGIHRLPKEQRPSEPAEERDARRYRVRAALDESLPYHDGLPASSWLDGDGLDRIIAAVRGSQPEED